MTRRAHPAIEVATLSELNDWAARHTMRPGWNKAERSLWPSPVANFVAQRWTWPEARAVLDASAGLISAEQTERRNVFLVNPVDGNDYATVRTMVAAYQGIMPGERALSHRHTPNALRLVLEGGPGIYTVVDGVRIDMEPGDVVLTPGWCWHGHGNDGEDPGYWIDYLDVPLVHLLEPMFFEPHPDGFESVESTTRDSPYVFPFAAVSAALAATEPDAAGRAVHLLDAPSLPTMRLSMTSLLDARSALAPWERSTANQIVSVVEGAGRTVIDGQAHEWGRGDVLAIPRWSWFRHETDGPAVLFAVSDAPVLEKLGFWRRESSHGRP